MSIKNKSFFGLKISDFSYEEIRRELLSNVNSNEKKVYYGYSFGYIPLYKKYPDLYKYESKFDIMVCDGTQFNLFMKLMGLKIRHEISIPFLSKLIMDIANENNFSMMIIGSTQETNKLATENVRIDYPNIKVYDGYDGGRFSESEQRQTVEIINEKSPDILFIGVSSPMKEHFAYRWKEELNVKIIVPFGGMIDGLAKKVWLTPPLLKKLGLSTLIRVMQEPRRFLLLNIWFMYETFFNIVPKTVYNVKIKGNRKYFIPGIYGIPFVDKEN